MKAPAFDYVRPTSIEEACLLLEQHGDDARLLAGGQTMMATLNMRLSEPTVLIDLQQVNGLRGISLQYDHVRIGALTRHSEIEDSALVERHAPLLALAAPHVAHRAIRNRGTIGGSVAYADPAAEWPSCCLALNATLVLQSARGQRRVPAEAFFLDLYTTAIQPGEIIVAFEFPLPAVDEQVFFSELVRRHGDYAIAGVAARCRFATEDQHNTPCIDQLRLAFMGVTTVPWLAQKTAALLQGVCRSTLLEKLPQAQACLEQELAPIGDVYHTTQTKQHLAKVLLERALHALLAQTETETQHG